jgi:hypothetical protein
MKVTANIATMPSRAIYLSRAIDTLYDQVDAIRVYCNNFVDLPDFLRRDKITVVIYQNDRTDNGKLYWANKIKQHEVYICCDDDISYPPDFVEVTLAAMKKYPGAIICYHGRKLWHGDPLKSYYHSHKCYHGMMGFEGDHWIDVPATYSAAWRTDEFQTNACDDKRMRMSDLLVALDAAKENVPVIAIGHKQGWFGYLNPPEEDTIYFNENRKDQVQSLIASEIYNIKYGD